VCVCECLRDYEKWHIHPLKTIPTPAHYAMQFQAVQYALF